MILINQFLIDWERRLLKRYLNSFITSLKIDIESKPLSSISAIISNGTWIEVLLSPLDDF